MRGIWLRLVVAVLFIGAVGVAVWQDKGVEAQESGNHRLNLPLLHKQYVILPWHNFVGVVRVSLDLYTVRGDSSDWGLFAADPQHEVWSPNGRYLLYGSAVEGGDPRVYVGNVATRETQSVTQGDLANSAWSPNNRYVVFSTSAQVYLHDVPTNSGRVVAAQGSVGTIYWSPNNRYVGYFNAAGLQIYNLESESTTTFPATSGFLSWSPDSRYVAFFGEGNLKVYDTTNGTVHAMPLEVPSAYGLIVWSPNSQALTWTYRYPTGATAYLWTVAATTIRVLPIEAQTALYWTPEGERLLLFYDRSNPQSQIYSLTVTSNQPPTLLLTGYTLAYFVDNGSRMLLRQGGQFYVSDLDGSNLTPFYNGGPATLSYFSIPKRDDRVILAYAGQRPVVQLTSSTTAASVEINCSTSVVWQSDGQYLSCENNGYLSLNYGAYIAEPLGNPITTRLFLSNHRALTSIANAPDYLAAQSVNFVLSPQGYPLPAYGGESLIHVPTGMVNPVTYPEFGFPVLHWHYLP